MARGVLTVTQVSRSGVALASETAGDATNGHQFTNDGNCFVLCHNTNGAATARTATFLQAVTIDGVATAGKQVSANAATTKLVGPFPTDIYGTTVLVDVSHAEMQLAVYRLTQ